MSDSPLTEPVRPLEAIAKEWLRTTLLAKGSSGLEDDCTSYLERAFRRIIGACSDPVPELTKFAALLHAAAPPAPTAEPVSPWRDEATPEGEPPLLPMPIRHRGDVTAFVKLIRKMHTLTAAVDLAGKTFAALQSAAPPERVSEGKGLGDYQELVDDLYRLFTSTSNEIAQFFGESRCTDDSARLNYALELMESYVTERPNAVARPAVEPREEPR